MNGAVLRTVRGPFAVAARFAVVLLLLVLLAPLARTADAGTRGKLRWAKHRLHQLEQEISSSQATLAGVKGAIDRQEARLRASRAELNALAGQLARTTARWQQTKAEIEQIEHRLAAARARYEVLRSRIDRRARIMYEEGPGTSVEFLFGATSLSDLTDRVELVSVVESQDSDLALQAQNVAAALKMQEELLQAKRAQQERQLRDLRRQQAALDRRFRSQQATYDRLAHKRSVASALITQLAEDKRHVSGLVAEFRRRLAAQARARALAAARAAQQSVTTIAAPSGQSVSGHPFQYCPVQGPHAYSDDFCQPRYTTNPPHPHAGNDIMAPRGTPIVAPFSGYASNASGGLGGLSVIVTGSQGYVYNAHVDHFGTLGSVSAGTVVGYVGNTGDAAGGPTHDHFEWHPNVIPANPWVSPYGYSEVNGAIDPYPYLNQVC
jgi:peptidoglycan hydrolase CwlO-like protein